MANKTSDAERIRLHLRTILAQLTARGVSRTTTPKTMSAWVSVEVEREERGFTRIGYD
jgi:hypothetical protein